jgi:hypothetical protein
MTTKQQSNAEQAAKEITALSENFYGTMELRFHNGLLAIVSTTSSKKLNDYLDRAARKDSNDYNHR